MTKKNLEIPTPERVPAELLLRHSVPAQPWQLATPQPILRAWDMSSYRPTRREFLIGAGSLLILAPYGCNTDSGQGGQTTSGNTRTVEHERGTTEVPRNPQRVVALYEFFVSYLAPIDSYLDAMTSQQGTSFLDTPQ